MGQRAHFHDCVSGDDVKGCLHVFAPHVVVVLHDWWDAFLVLGQLLNSQCFNTIIDSPSSKQVKVYGERASRNRKQQDTSMEQSHSRLRHIAKYVLIFVMFSVDSVTQNSWGHSLQL